MISKLNIFKRELEEGIIGREEGTKFYYPIRVIESNLHH
jgi:hypothetical protein